MRSLRTDSHLKLFQPSRRPKARVVPTLMSLTFHAALLLSLVVSYRSGADSGTGGGPSEFTTVITRDSGVVWASAWGDRPDAQLDGTPNDVPPGDLSAVSTAGNELLQKDLRVTGDTPPAELLLPSEERSSTNDWHSNPSTRMEATILRGMESTGAGRSAARGTLGHPDGIAGGGAPSGGFGVDFFGTRDVGMKIVFVLDASGSMTSHNAMQVAKEELIASLQALDERQQFLLIFYDDAPRAVKLRNESKPLLSPATGINKTLARQQVSGIQPGEGTNHSLAVELALKTNSDVIFLLTDAAEPPMPPAELERVKRQNNGRTRIHSIELGFGPELAKYTSNFLRRLAQQNGGTYRYHDVTKFKGP